MKIGDVLALLFAAGIVYILVRPRSQAAQVVTALGTAAVAMVRRAADLAE